MLKLKISFPVTTKEETRLWSRFKCSFFRKYNCRPELIRSRQLDFLSCFIIYLLSLYTSVLHTQLRFPFGLKFRTTKIFYFSIYFRYTFSYSSLSLLPHQLQDFYHSFLQNAFFCFVLVGRLKLGAQRSCKWDCSLGSSTSRRK